MNDTANGPIQIFDRASVRRHRARADLSGEHGFLFRELAERLAERLGEFDRNFANAALFGDRAGLLQVALDSTGVKNLRGVHSLFTVADEISESVAGYDDDALNLGVAKLDLVMSHLTLHWINDLPGVLLQINKALRPDGLFLSSMFGGETLTELRQALSIAEEEIEGGVSPRVSPFIDIRDAGALLQRAGFALPLADIDTIVVTYEDIFSLMQDLRGMGETNAVHQRRKTFVRQETLMRAGEIYAQEFSDSDGRLRATFQTVFLTGWAPDESQPKPLRPGSAKARLADALGTEEIPTGEKPGH